MKPSALLAVILIFGCALGACRRGSGDQKITKQEFARLVAEYEKKKKEEAERQKKPKPAKKGTPVSSPSVGPSQADEQSPHAAGEDEGAPEAEAAAGAKGGASGAAKGSHAGSGKERPGPWILDDATPIAPAGPAAATPLGVVMYNRRDEVHVARLGAVSSGTRAVAAPLTPISKSAAPFPLGRAPAVSDRYAYWVTAGKLVRRSLPLKGGEAPLEVLATDARDGARVAIPFASPASAHASLPPMAAYIVRANKEDDPLIARLWVEGGPTQVLTAEGSSTHSVVLVATGDGVLAISLAARMSMTPVHARPIRFVGGSPVADEDIVVWVGGGVQPLTEISAVRSGDTVFGFLPQERSITEFGLAQLNIGLKPNMDTPTTWIPYPNGIDPAPAATGDVCGQAAILYAEPANEKPDAPQELVLKSIDPRGDGAAETIASAKAFYDVSLSGIPGGALVAYVADWVTWAVTVRCRGGAKGNAGLHR